MLSQSTHFSHYTGLVGRLSGNVLIENNREKRCWYYVPQSSFRFEQYSAKYRLWWYQQANVGGRERESWICDQEARVQILLGHIFYVISHSYHYGSCVFSYARLTPKYIIFHKIYRTPSKTKPVKCPCSKSSTKVWDHWVQNQSSSGTEFSKLINCPGNSHCGQLPVEAVLQNP